MVHNGIEYGIMQTIAEAYDMLRLMFLMPAPQIGQIFNRYNKSKLNSFLYELTADILQKIDDQHNNGYLIDHVLDKAAQKGTGMWTVIDSLEHAVPVPTIAEAVFSRIVSGDKDHRIKISKEFPKKIDRENLDLDKFIHDLDDALFAAMICIFAQGIELIQKTSTKENWNTDITEVLRIWQGGCIIRAKLLKSLEHCFSEEAESKNDHVFELPQTIANLKGNIGNLRDIVEIGVRNQVPIPALSSSLAYFESMTQENSSANLIQGLRDAFGAHTYERTDRSGSFHSNWTNKK
jgi:6-phosphogluconate dehydrogenase